MSAAWLAGPDEARAVAGLMAQFRDHLGSAEPSDASVLRSVERIMADPDSEFLLAGDGPSAVLQLRFRWSVWKEAPDAWIEDLFVRAAARRAGLGDALVRLAYERAAVALYERTGFDAHSKGATRSLLLGRLL